MVSEMTSEYPPLLLYDVEKLYVDQISLEERGLTEDDLVVDVEVLSSAEIGKLMAEQDLVVHH